MSANRREFLRSSLAASTLVSMGADDGPRVPRPLGPGGVGPRNRTTASSSSSSSWAATTASTRSSRTRSTATPRARRALRLPSGTDPQTLSDEIGLHPSMGEMAKLVEAGHASVIQGVGYPEPGPLALPLDGDLGERPARIRRDSRPAGLAGPSTPRPAADALRPPRPARRLPVAADRLEVEEDRGPLAHHVGAISPPDRRRRRRQA